VLKRAKTIDHSSAGTAESRALTKRRPDRQVVVSPADVFQADTREVRLVSLERVIFRYMGVTAVIIVVATLIGLGWILLGA
jgi:hypothetical protein